MNKKNKIKPKEKNSFEHNEFGILKYPKLIIFAFLLLTYFQVVKFDFVYLDDDLIILDNHDKISSLSNIPKAFTSQYGFNQGTPYYRPITMISFIIDAQISHKSPVFYHISNLIFHFLVSILLFRILVELNFQKVIALFTTLIFVVHPLLTNSVVWIVGRNDLLAGFFCLLSFFYFIKFLHTNAQKYLISHSIFYFLGILSKEVTIVLPLMCVIYFYWFCRNEFKRKMILNTIFAWIFPIFFFIILRHTFVADVKNVTYGIDAFVQNVQSIPDTISKIFLPFNLAVLPTYTIVRTLIGSLFLSILLLLPIFIKNIRKKNYYFGLLWFLAFMLPGLLVLYSNQSERFEYLDTRAYLPMIGILFSFSELLQIKTIDPAKTSNLIKGIVVILILAVLTFFQSKKYQNAIVFAESAVESNPEKAFFYQKLADYYFTKNDFKLAASYLEKSIEKAPNNYLHYKNLSLAYFNLGDNQKAEATLEKAYNLNPKDFEVLSALIKLNYNLGRYKEALFFANKVIELGGSVDAKLLEDLKALQK